MKVSRKKLVASLAASDPSALRGRDEQLAFWSNAYNILAMDLVVEHAPEQSIKDIGSLFFPVWKKPAGKIGGKTYSLDEIEHGIVRPLGDPRAHVAVICASLSCPPLRREPRVLVARPLGHSHSGGCRKKLSHERSNKRTKARMNI